MPHVTPIEGIGILYKNWYNVIQGDRPMDVVSYSDSRAQLKSLMDRVVADHTPVVISRQRAESVVMVSLSDWTAMEETMHLLSSGANASRLRSAIGQLDADQGKTRDLLEP